MGIFSPRARVAQRDSPGATATARTGLDGEKTPRPPTSGANALRNSLQQLYALKPTRQVFAEEAVKILAKSANTKAMALLHYDPRPERLRVMAFDGLEPDAVQCLGGDSGHISWDIPLRAVRNRRINVIESAQTNPFVPKALLAVNPRQLAIATVPFYHANTPVGVAVLFSPTQRGFPDALLQSLSQALRVCATALVELPSGSDAPEKAHEDQREQPTLLKSVATLKAELTRLTRALEEAERQRAAEAAERVTAESFLKAQRERVAALEQELAQLRAGRERSLELENALQGVNAQLLEAQAAGQAAQRESERLQAALAEAQQALADESGSVEVLTATRDELQRRLEAAQDLQEQNEKKIAGLTCHLEEAAARAADLEPTRRNLEAAERAKTQAEERLADVQQQLEAQRAELDGVCAALAESSAALAARQSELEALGKRMAQAETGLAELEAARRDLSETRQRLESGELARQSLSEELDRLRSASASEARELENTLEEWTTRLRAMESERDHLRAELEGLQHSSGERIAHLERLVSTNQAERGELARRLDEAARTEAERDRLQARLEELESELGATRHNAEALNGRVQQLSDVNARLIAERRELHARIETLTRGGQTLEQEKQAAINAAQARVTELESALSRMAKALDAARAAAVDESSRLRGELSQLAETHERLGRELADRQQALSAREEEAARVGAEAERLRSELQQAQRGRGELTAELDASRRSAGELQRAREQSEQRLAAIESELGEAQKARDAFEAQLHRTREQLGAEAAARLATAERERQAIEAALAAEREARAAEVSDLTRQLAGVRSELTIQLEEMAQRHEAAQESFRAECDRLERALAEKDEILQTVEERLSAGDLGDMEVEVDLESILAIDRSTTETESPEPAVLGESASPSEVAILDAAGPAESAVGHLLELGYRAAAIVADAGNVAEALAGHRIACAAVNLGLGTAWPAIRALRQGADGATPPLLAYALAPGSSTGFWFGPVDFSILPVKENVIELLQRMMPKVRRVIAMSSDLDVMSGLRAELNKARISTAVVLDGRQALDLVPTVRPEAAVLHLSPICADVFRAIGGLRSTEAGRDIPILFLMDETPHPREEAFLSAGIRMLSGRGNLKSDELPSLLADMLGSYRSAA